MPSPDLTDLVDLVLYDKDPYDLVQRAILDATVKLPGWIPREGNTELVLLEGTGLQVAEAVYAINRLPGAVLDVLLRLFGITRNVGTAPTADVRFNVADLVGHVIPAGTRVSLDLGGTAEPLVFATDAAVLVAAGSNSAVAAATATRATALGNGVPAGTLLAVETQIAWVNTAQLETPPVDGIDPEAEADWRARALRMFQTLRSTLVLPDDFTAEALGFPGVYRATTVDRWDSTAAGGAGAVANGHVSTFVLGEGGVALSSGAKADLAAQMQAKASADLVVHVADPVVTPVNVAVTVHRFVDWATADVAANVTDALQAYLSPDAWDWDTVVRRNELIGLLSDVDGVRYVEVLTTPAADVNLPGAAALASAGSLAVTVNG